MVGLDRNNLNNSIIADGNHDEEEIEAKNYRQERFQEFSTDSAKISVYFRNLQEKLIEKINQYSVIVGCVAWLTNEDVLKALATREKVSIIIQKEDFLRPDTGDWSSKKQKRLYGNLPPGPSKSGEYWGDLLQSLNISSTWDSEPIRWAGNFNTEKSPAFPRMHNKFLVFCEFELVERLIPINDDEADLEKELKIVPKAVWTGSFNITKNGTMSLENSVYIVDTKISKAYYDEWQYIFALSESIPNKHWKKYWTPEEFRIGT
ncbi:MAG: hypothetical protein F6K39_11185 [Okeania sp. SIO3B3]|nr:hypothetical protein [Okeania sp. SIO3B3]